MSVLIKDMEMPKPKFADMETVYDAYVLVSPNGHAAIVVDNEDGLDSTEFSLVHVPKHGRLIDADALKSDGFHTLVCHTGKMPYEFTAMLIDDAPTIIKAEEENDI